MNVATRLGNDQPPHDLDKEIDPAAGVDPAWLGPAAWRELGRRRIRVTGAGIVVDTVRGEVVAAVRTHGGRLLEVATTEPVDLELLCDEQGLGAAESFEISRTTGRTLVRSADGPGLLYGLHHVLRLGAAAFAGEAPARRHAPEQQIRMLDHWDNIDLHPVMARWSAGMQVARSSMTTAGCVAISAGFGRMRECSAPSASTTSGR